MWHIARHEIVLTGSHDDPSYWSSAFVLRCYNCTGGHGPITDVPVWSTDEYWDESDYELDFEAAIAAVIEHTGPLGPSSEGDVAAALFIAKMTRRIECGLSVLQDVSNQLDNLRGL